MMAKLPSELEDNANIPAITASCPRCDLLFSETLDQSMFSKEELIAIEWAANFFNNMADRILPQSEADKAREQAKVLNNLLERFLNKEPK
jgi:hypothetical protein